MRLSDGQLRVSPTDLNGFLSCPHLTMLELAVARGELKKPFRKNLHAEIIQTKGDEHEERYLDGLRAEGKSIVEPETAAETEAAIRDRAADVIYQARLEHDGWRGIADFVELQPDGFYEVVDTKLARRARPQHVLQLSYYTEQVARIQGHAPEAMHVVNGLGERETFRPGDFAAYYRRLKRRFLDAVEERSRHLPLPGRFLRPLRLPLPLQGALGGGRPPHARRGDLAHAGGAAGAGGDHDARAPRRGRARDTCPRACGRRPSRGSATRPSSSSTGAAPASTGSISSRRRRSAASPSCRSRATATSGSTTRATLGSSRRAGSST